MFTGEAYHTEKGDVFVKFNKDKDALQMFYGEKKSLEAIQETQTIKVPAPMAIVADPESVGGALVLEYLELGRLTEWNKLASDLASLHLFNSILGRKKAKLESWVGKSKGVCAEEPPEQAKTLIEGRVKVNVDDKLVRELDYVDEFGFDVPTCCGKISQNNEWSDNWIEFYARNRLDAQIKSITENYGDREVIEYWSELQLSVHQFFTDCTQIEPALLHGDLWSGNIGQVQGTPVIFDPSSFYGHSEFDLSISNMFGGFPSKFYTEYFKKIPKVKGFER